MLSASIDHVLATLGVAVAYLALVRLADVNEREPIWSVLVAFVIGGAAAGALFLGVDRVVLTLGAWPGAILREVALGVSLAVVCAVLAAVSRLQGWPLMADVLDGIIYGAAAGLGFTCAETIATIAPQPSLVTLAAPPLVDMAATSALSGLAQGVFGAMIGAGFGMTTSRRGATRWLWPLLGVALAIAAHGLHDVLAHGDALAGEAALWRSRLALALPLAAVVGFAAFELVAERRMIAHELAVEVQGGDVTAGELSLLNSVVRRQGLYLSLLLRTRFDALRALAALHNQQVMLALLKRRAARGDDATRAQVQGQVARLRQAIRGSRARLAATPEVTR